MVDAVLDIRFTIAASIFAVLVGWATAHRPWYQAWLRCPIGIRALPKALLLLALILSGLVWPDAFPITAFFIGTVWFGPKVVP